MHDYQLDRLNTRSFEQLTQALGLETLGKQLTIFGDGPDGGREATFEGEIDFPSGPTKWNGFGILQAKFRQVPDSSAKKNADWAIAQLTEEFKKFKPRSKLSKSKIHGARTCPKYYVFATNLALSAVAEKGGKDRIRTLLDGFKKSHGLTDYVVWDGDQIRRLLDTAPAIRTTYLAWVLPSDVLAEMMKLLGLQNTEFPSTITRYLESELLDDQYARLGQGGYTDANAIPLSNVFVDLPVELPSSRNSLADIQADLTHSERRTFLEVFLEAGRQNLRPSANTPHDMKSYFGEKVAGRLVLIGGPGQGKTTVGQFACQLFRAALLKQTNAQFSPEITQALARIKQQSVELPTVKALRYPLRIDLKKLAESLAKSGEGTSNSVLDYLVQHISKRTDSDLSKADFRKWLRAYPWLVVLDGLDEVPSSSNRTKMMDAIRDFVSVEAHQQDADLMILATTRPQGYSDEFNPDLYAHLPLLPLNAKEALQYGRRLAEARHPGLKTRVEELSASLERATTNPATIKLMESPLQVTIMLALIEGGGEPPEQRWKLFHDYYDVIYRREKERGTTFSAILSRYESDIHWIHHRAGWLLQQRNAAEGATATKLMHLEFEAMVDMRLQSRGHDDLDKRARLVKDIREAATDRLVFLVGSSEHEIGFEIRSLQEFMAAEHCFDGAEQCVRKTLKAIAPYSYWRNVFLFIAGRIFFERESLTDSLIAVCDQLNEPTIDEANGFIVSGSRLAFDMLKDGAARNQPQNSRVLARCATRLLDGQELQETPAFAALFDTDAGNVFVESLRARLTQDSPHLNQAGWKLCIALAGAKSTFADEMLRNYFPWAHPDVSLLVADLLSDDVPVPDVFVELMKEHIFDYPPLITRTLKSKIYDQILKSTSLGFLALISSDSIDRFDVPVLDDYGQPTAISINVPQSAFLPTWAKLKLDKSKVKSMHQVWQMCHAISEFARDPGEENLALQVDQIYEHATDRGPVHIQYPWQIAVIVRASRLGIDRAEVRFAIESGALGRRADWIRWRELKEVRTSQLSSVEAHEISDAHLGQLLMSETVSINGSGKQRALRLANALTVAQSKLETGSRIEGHFVKLTCHLLNDDFLRGDSPKNWTADDQKIVQAFLRTACASNVGLDRNVVTAIIRSPMPCQEKIELLDLIAKKLTSTFRLNSHHWRSISGEVNVGVRELIETATHTGQLSRIVCALSFIPPVSSIGLISINAIDQCVVAGVSYKDAAIAVRVCAFKWMDADAVSLASEIVNLTERRPTFLHDLLEFIDFEGMSGSRVEALLLAILASQRREHRSRDQLFKLLVKVVERRTAVNTLPDPILN